MSEPTQQTSRAGWLILGVALIGAALYPLLRGDSEPPTAPATHAQQTTAPGDSEKLDAMIRTEELIRGFHENIDDLSYSLRNLELPDGRSKPLFWPLLSVGDLGPRPEVVPASSPIDGGAPRSWPVAPVREDVSAADLRLWRSLLDEVEYFENGAFKIKRARFLDPPDRFETDVAFAGLARLRSGDWSWVKSKQKVVWKLIPGLEPESPASWRIEGWKTIEATVHEAPALLFRDAIDQAIPDPGQRERARASLHERHVVEYLLAKARKDDTWQRPHERFAVMAQETHPGLAVADVNGDGFDDLYVMARWGRNQLFRNRGDGTFEEVAAELGLDVEDHSSSAIFADFDNDGDADLFLGRTEVASLYFENEGGLFIDRSAEQGPLPRLVTSLSAADYDGDGLLDLYLSTYGAKISEDEYRAMLDETELRQIQELAGSAEWRFVDTIGPPNALLHNLGGRFEKVADPGPLKAFRNTYQATWADYDEDGDPDVYLANDFAPDTMVRNDGNGVFVDVSQELGITDFGFGMGASWGDYDRDGHEDLYVSNMYSSAGSRITEQLDYLDPRYRQGAQGNYLYRNEPGSLHKVSGDGPSDLDVQHTGWSWGSQFADVDNDGFLDIVVLNGFYTVPPHVARAGDT